MKFRGTSLNKSLLTSPGLLQNLIQVVFKFRQHQFAASADIEVMFFRDKPSLRFLWMEYPTKNVVVYQYTRNIVGANDSRYLCTARHGPKQHKSAPGSNQIRPRRLLHGRLPEFSGVPWTGSQEIEGFGAFSPFRWVQAY